MRNGLILLVAAIACLAPGLTRANTTVYPMGDLDGGYYNGPDSGDHVYSDPDWWNAYQDYDPTQTLSRPTDRLDLWVYDRGLVLTFLFTPQTIEEAYLQIVLMALSPGVITDAIQLEARDAAHATRYSDLGFSVSRSAFTLNTVDLSDVGGRSYLGDMADGKLNVNLGDDCVIDFLVLTIGGKPMPITPVDPAVPWPPPLPPPPPVPAPGAILLGTLGTGLVGWMRRRRVL